MPQQRVIHENPQQSPSPRKPAPRGEMRRQRKYFDEPMIGTRVKALSVLRGFSLRELSAATGLKYTRIRNIVYGLVQDIHSHELQLIAAALLGNLAWLCGSRGDPLEERFAASSKPAAAQHVDSLNSTDVYEYLRDPNHPRTKQLGGLLERKERGRVGRV